MNSVKIEEIAKTSFTHERPQDWTLVTEEPDRRHLDFNVHVPEHGKPSGLDFYVQLKGVVKPRQHSGKLAHRYATKHLRFWIDKCQRPVFLVLVDVRRREAYFACVHDWHRNAPEAWRSQGKATVYFAPENRVRDHVRLMAAVKAADDEMRCLRPPPFPNAAKHELGRLKALDDRFSYELRALGERTEIVVRAKETVSGMMEARGESGVRKFRQLVESGEAQEFSGGEFRVVGDGLFAEIRREAGDGPITVALESTTDVEARLLTRREDGAVVEAISGLYGTARGGKCRRSFACRLSRSPIAATGMIELHPNEGRVSGSYRLEFELDAWRGAACQQLPQYDRVERCIAMLHDAQSTWLELRFNGLRVLEVELDMGAVRRYARMVGRSLELVDSLGRAAKKLGVVVLLPALERASENELLNLELETAVALQGEARWRVPHASFSGALKPAPDLAAALKNHKVVLEARLVEEAKLLGVVSPIWAVEKRVGPLVLSPESRAQIEAAPISAAESLSLVFCGCEDTRVMASLIRREAVEGSLPGLTLTSGSA